MRLVKFGNLILPQENTRERHTLPIQNLPLAVGVGSVDSDIGLAKPLARPITRNFWKIGSQVEINSFLDDLNYLSTLGILPLYALDRNNNLKVALAKLINNGFPTDVDTYNCRLELSLTFQLYYPYWLEGLDSLDTGFYLDGSSTLDGFQDSRTVSTDENFTLSVGGISHFEVGALELTVESGASLLSFEVINNTSSHSFKVSTSMVAGDVLTLDFGLRIAELNGTDIYSKLDITNPKQTAWFQLYPGDNDIDYKFNNLSGGNITVVLTWFNHYL